MKTTSDRRCTFGCAAALTAAMLLAGGEAAAAEKPADWVKAGMYDVRIKSVVRCGSGGDTAAAAGPRLLGVELQVRSNVRPLFVAARDATLWDGGVMFPAARSGELPRCKPSFRPANLRRGAQAGGFVVFEIPSRGGALVLRYTPTRWGGADSVQIPIAQPD
jgi:hypothetical protein